MKVTTAIIFLIMATASTMVNNSFYDFNVDNIDGEEVSLQEFEGKVVMVVNVASKCGFTPQYEGLQHLYEEYKDQDFVILGFPANNFNDQEPGSEEEIKKFCRLNYGVEFPMFSKVSVKGEDQAKLFQFLTEQPNPDFEGEIKWNFEKFLIDKNGSLQRRFRSNVEPESKEIVSAIEQEIAK